MISMSRAWDKEKNLSPWRDSNLWPPKHRAGALSTWATENSFLAQTKEQGIESKMASTELVQKKLLGVTLDKQLRSNQSCRRDIEMAEINTFIWKIANFQIGNVATSHSLPNDMALLLRLRSLRVRKTLRKSATCCLFQQKYHLRSITTLGWLAYFAESSATRNGHSYT